MKADKTELAAGSWNAFNNTTRVRKQLHTIFIRGIVDPKYGLPGDTETVVANLPNEYKPSLQIAFPLINMGGLIIGSGYVTTDGQIRIKSTVATNYWTYFVSYPID